jgi:hypothetical protein
MRSFSFLFGFAFFITSQLARGQLSSSNLPVIIIETDGRVIEDEQRIVANMKVINHPRGKRNYITSTVYEYDGKISIEIRGNTSQAFPKKQYAFETQDNFGENRNISLIGMPEENDWILYAPYIDKSLIRDVLAMELSAGMGNYAPRSRFCELLLNGEYMGLYVLMEKIKRDTNRVNISTIQPDGISGDELTGGYILKIDRVSADCEDEAWYTDQGKVLMQCEYPGCEDILPEQLEYCRSLMNDFESALFSDDFSDPVLGYRKHIDFNSFLDYFLLNELANNIDAYILSTFLYKDRDSKGGKLVMGPVWDFNIAFGNSDYRNGFATDSLQALRYPWWKRFLEDPGFNTAAAERWVYHRDHSLNTGRLLFIIDSLTNLLDESQQRNFARWDILGAYIWPNYFIGTSYANEVDYLAGWTVNRLNWLDNYFNQFVNDPCCFTENKITAFYPNPFEQYFTLDFETEEEGDVSFLLSDIMGRKRVYISAVHYQPGQYKKTYFPGHEALSDLEAGLYILVMLKDGVPVDQVKVMCY